MRVLTWLTSAAVLSLGVDAGFRPSPEQPFHALKEDKTTPHSIYTDHFSSNTSNTGVKLQQRLEEYFAGESVVTTDDWSFNPQYYASGHPDELLIRQLEEIEPIKKLYYIPPRKRVEGSGVEVTAAVFAGFEMAFRDHEFKAILAQYPEGYGYVQSWYIVGDAAAARQFVFEVSAWCYTPRDTVLVYDKYWKYSSELYKDIQKASWDDVILDPDFKTRLQKDYRAFFKAEKTYKDLGVPWKRGLILLGPPGNGKTISLKAIAKEVNIPILYVKSLSQYDNGEMSFGDIFQRARAEAPCLLIFEDLDSLINDNNRYFFLNEVDGLVDNDGLLLIGTTNHVDRLDPALSNRPSRFDRQYSFPDPKVGERKQYAVYWQKKLHSNTDIRFPDELVDEVAEKTDKFSFAFMKEAFVSALLTLAGNDDGKDHGNEFPEVVLDQIKRIREQLDNAELLPADSGPRITLSGGGRGSRMMRELPDGYGMGRHGPRDHIGLEQMIKLDDIPMA